MAKSHKWTFKTRFRTNAYGWKGTSLASKRLREAVSEIKKVARKDPALAAEGAVTLMEKLWPSLQGIDTSSGALSGAVNRTLKALIEILIAPSVDMQARAKWLDRLYAAVLDDGVDYLAPVEDAWGKIAVFPELANHWAETLLPLLRTGSSDSTGWIKGTSICLSCLLEVGRHEELQELTAHRRYRFWSFDKFWAEALVRQGRIDDAVSFADDCHESYDQCGIAQFCEQALLDADRRSEAYTRFAQPASETTTNLATFRTIARKYPERDPEAILKDLISAHGEPGKWFAAAKDADLLELAVSCAQEGSTDPSTLIRAARDYKNHNPDFSSEVALCALTNLMRGGGYEPTPLDVCQAYRHLFEAARSADRVEWAKLKVDALVNSTSGRDSLLYNALRSEHHRQFANAT